LPDKLHEVGGRTTGKEKHRGIGTRVMANRTEIQAKSKPPTQKRRSKERKKTLREGGGGKTGSKKDKGPLIRTGGFYPS